MAVRSEEVRQIRSRFYVLAVFAGIAYGALVARLYTLQVKHGEEFTQKSEQNVEQQLRLIADRGLLYDNKGRLLVDNRAALDLYVTPAFLKKADFAIAHVAEVLELNEEEAKNLARRIKGARRLDRYKPQLVRRDITRDQLELIESERVLGGMEGFAVVDSGTRDYREGELLAHVTGYLNEIGPQELEAKRASGRPEDKSYELGDLVGRRGLERTFETYLRGKDGYEKIVVDSKGRRQREEVARQLLGADRRVPATPGNNLKLSIDLDAQSAAEKTFTRDKEGNLKAGVTIAVEVDTGFILAFFSTPAYDPNRVTGRLLAKEKEALDNNPKKPWINRAIQEQYAPGSTYKAFTALTALDKGFITPNTVMSCPGYYRSGSNTWRCFKDSGHGGIALHFSLVASCDTFYYSLGAKMGIEPMAETARKFGLGQRSGIDLDEEISGIVPDIAYHNQAQRNEGGYKPGFAVNTSVGQGANAFTPLQLVMAYAAIANGGTLYRPQLVRRIEDPNGKLVKEFQPEVVRKIDFKPEHYAEVRSGLCGVVNEQGGTAYGKRQADLRVCGKTGTAQVAKLKKRVKNNNWGDTDEKLIDNAWFVGFAPEDHPRVAVVTLTEHGGFGGAASAPTTMAVIRSILLGEMPKEQARLE